LPQVVMIDEEWTENLDKFVRIVNPLLAGMEL
jgi:hypothetical protein